MRLLFFVKIKLRKVMGMLLSLTVERVLKSFGYRNSGAHFYPVPESSFYQNSRTWNAFVGLHNIPSNKYWLESKRHNRSVKDGELVPWITYPALSCLEKVDFTKLSCVEFGSGASTFWFAARCKDFVTFEFDRAYHSSLSVIPSMENLDLVESSGLLNYFNSADYAPDKYQLYIHKDLDNLGISKSALHVGSKVKGQDLIIKIRKEIANADFVFIDGGPRNFLIALAAEHLRSEALLVIDNSDLDYVQLGLEALKSEGFREIPFVGFGPLNPFQWQTSIFIKSLEPLDFLK
jgi:hypothetical protein